MKCCYHRKKMSSKAAAKTVEAMVVKPPPKPKNVRFSRALFPYTSKEEDELSFEEGDLLYIIDDSSDPDWWRARLDHFSPSLLPHWAALNSIQSTVLNIHHNIFTCGEAMQAIGSHLAFPARSSHRRHLEAREARQQCGIYY